ncbi:MAG: UbiD family decarboxylase [Deltaproteobacteria bacterium]|nr:UbiD family decarboxylase [Deltaproteobacteria bacterium]
MPKNLSTFLEQLWPEPGELKQVTRPIKPQAFEATALLEHLDRRGDTATVLFEKPENLLGQPSQFRLVSNLFATRERIAEAIGHPRSESGLPLSLEMARRERLSLPAVDCPGPAPVQEQVWRGDDADVRTLPVVRHYEKDLGPVLTMMIALKDPDDGFYEISFAKTFYRDDPRRTAASLHTPHLERVLAKYAKLGRPAPAVNILGHHPAFSLGVLAATPFGTNDYDTIGAYLGEPLRLAPSVTWGKDFLVPADAEIILEGEVRPDVPMVVDPFGEVTKFYQPQCIRTAFDIKAITARKGAILQDIFSGHQGHWNMSAIPKEGSIYNSLQQRFGNVCAVHMPHSMCSRLGCYISIKKEKEGIAKQVGHAALLESSFFQWIIVVDEDIDVFNEKEVIWALASYTDPSRDIDFVKNSFTLFNTAAGYQKTIIDATRPLDYPFPERFKVPDEIMAAIRSEEW